METKSIILAVYADKRTVFSLADLAMITGITNPLALRQSINYYVKKGEILNPRKGIYTKINFDVLELACKIYSPSYISNETVLQKEGLIFQYYEKITLISYLSRSIYIEKSVNNEFSFRKIKNNILLNTTGINRLSNGINIACAERAFLDTLYLSGNYYFDNLNILNKNKVKEILQIYQSKSLQTTAKNLLDYA